MRIGIDISVLQTPNRMRGIGSTVINFINNLSDRHKSEHDFVFYISKSTEEKEVLDLLKLKGVKYEVEYLNDHTPLTLKVPRRLAIINRVLSKTLGFLYYYKGDPRLAGAKNIDAFIQFDQALGTPSKRLVKSYRFLHDIIPYVLEADYLWSYSTARQNGLNRKSALKKGLGRKLYATRNRIKARNAHHLIANSNHTKSDFVQYLKINPSRITVAPLGVQKLSAPSTKKLKIRQYRHNAWGDFKGDEVDLTTTPFLLYVGGADPRRRLVDLVAAFNNLKARGRDIKLVLAGDTLLSPQAIPTLDIQKYLLHSSYLNDIVFLGFVTEEQRTWLYRNALAFVFPSVYEGFGLPVLEAMNEGCPVICYKNSSIPEVAGDAAIFAHKFEDIYKSAELLMDSPERRTEIINKGYKQAKNFTWSHTSNSIMDVITAGR